MKKLQSTVEGVWVELAQQPSLTEGQKALLMSEKEEDSVAKTALIKSLNSKKSTPATSFDEKIAQDRYDFVKPVLKETDVYILISADIILDEKNLSGILNCRVNGEHKQIRF